MWTLKLEKKGYIMDMRYEPPNDTQDYAPRPQIAWFDDNDIPDILHHRAMWVHALNVTLENACASDDDDYPEIHHGSEAWHVWSRVQKKVFEYWQAKRDTNAEAMPHAHRYLLWHVWARIQFVLHYHSRRLKRAHACDFVAKRRLCAAHGSALQYSVADLWRAVHVLTTVWNTLRYSTDLRDYVAALATQCGRYFWVALPSRQIFDHPSFVTRVADATGLGVAGGAAACAAHYCVNEKFTIETERLFFRLLGEIHEHEALVKNAEHVHTAPRAASYTDVSKWIRRAADVGAVREFVAADFADLVFQRRALPGEVERFAERDQHADATAYNAIAQLRPEVIDQMAEMIDREDLIEALIDRVQMWDDDAHRARVAGDTVDDDDGGGNVPTSAAELQREAEVDIDASDIIITASGYLLDDAFLSDHIRFATWFVCPAPPIPGAKHRYPVLVRACHAWHVAFGTELWLCDNAADAVVCWVRELCASEDAFEAIHHVAPRKGPFFAACRKLMGGERAPADIAARAERRRRAQTDGGATIMVPLAYEDEGDIFDGGYGDGEDE